MSLPAHDYLDRGGIAYEKRTFSSDKEKGASNVAHALGCSEDQVVKTLIFETHKREHVLVMVAARGASRGRRGSVG